MLDAQGEFSFQDLRNADNFFGPLFFFLANIFLTLILLNFFIAIVSDGYVSARTFPRIAMSTLNWAAKSIIWFLLKTWRLPIIGKKLKAHFRVWKESYKESR